MRDYKSEYANYHSKPKQRKIELEEMEQEELWKQNMALVY